MLESFLWKVARSTWRHMREARLLMVSSSLAYTTILSLVPMLAVSFAIFQAFGGLNKLYDTLAPFIMSNLNKETGEQVISSLKFFVENAHASFVGVSGFIALVFTSMSMLSSAEKALNQVWQTPFRRSLFQRFATYWLFITLGPLALSVAVGAATSSQLPLQRYLPGGTGLFFLVILVIFSIYKWGPHCKVRWLGALISAVVAALFWNFARLGFALYTSQVITYHKVYGSLGAFPILLLWIYILWVIFLGGAALNAAIQKSRLGIE